MFKPREDDSVRVSGLLESAVKEAALVLVGVTVAFGAAETALRVSGRFPTASLHSVSTHDYHRIPGPWEPNQDLLTRTYPLPAHRVRINSLGLRGPETTLKPREERILCIGDSYTFGYLVNDEETLPAQLEARLVPGVEVLNGGVGGSTIVDQSVYLDRMLGLEPRVVLLLLSENDVADLLRDTPLHVQIARHRTLKSGRLAPLFRAVRHTAVFNLLLRASATIRAWNAPVVTSEAEHAPKPFRDGVLRYAAAVRDMRDALHSRGISLVFAAFPSWYSLSEQKVSRRIIGPVLEALKAEGIDGIDLTSALRATGLPPTALYLLPHDGHPSPRAYAIAAEALAPRLRTALRSSPKAIVAQGIGRD